MSPSSAGRSWVKVPRLGRAAGDDGDVRLRARGAVPKASARPLLAAFARGEHEHARRVAVEPLVDAAGTTSSGRPPSRAAR